MKPFRTLLFLLSVFLLLIAVALYFPDKGIPLFKNLKLQFFTSKDIFSQSNTHYADIQKIIKQQEVLNDTVLTELAYRKTIVGDSAKIVADSILNNIQAIEYPNGDTTVLYPFFKALKNLDSSGQLIRIMHYGDSQIEDDRITSFLRNKLQTKFGGSGVGLVPASQLYPYSFSMTQANSDNWERYIIFGKKDSAVKHGRFGVLGSYCSFSTDKKISNNDTTDAEAWIKFSPSPYAFRNTKSFMQCRIFYGYNKDPFINEIFQDDKLMDADIIPPVQKLEVIRWKFDTPQSRLTIKFKGISSPEIFGIALDGYHGIAVDNIPLRGCSGLFFTQMDENLLASMYKELNVKLFILQFGGNFVPAGLENYKGYELWFSGQIMRIKKTCPGACVLVIGVADMSVKDKDSYVTYHNLEKVRDAIRNAAFKSGAAFWDMYEAMGGKNSMPSWVFATPPLASGDFVHFNPKGAKTIAQMFYNSFILEYHRYEKSLNQ